MEVNGQLDIMATFIPRKGGPGKVRYESGLIPEPVWTRYFTLRPFYLG